MKSPQGGYALVPTPIMNSLLRKYPNSFEIYSYCGHPLAKPDVQVITNHHLLSMKLGNIQPESITQDFIQNLIKETLLTPENTLDPARCVGFAVGVVEEGPVTKEKVQIFPLQLTSAQASGTQGSQVNTQLFLQIPEIVEVMPTMLVNRALHASALSPHFFSNALSASTNHKIIVFQGSEGQQQTGASAASADEPLFSKTTQAVAAERAEAAARAEQTAANADTLHNLGDLDNSLPKEETDTTD